MSEKPAAGQHVIIQRWASVNNYKLAHTVLRTTTYAGTTFSECAEFRKAIRLAGDLTCALVIADISELLCRTSAQKIVGCVVVLDTTTIDIWDAHRNTRWASMPLTAKNAMMNRAVAVQVSRAIPIKFGLNSVVARRKSSANNWEKGNSANQTKADAFARQYMHFVRAEMEKLPPGRKLSPSSLARALNDEGQLSSRSGLWNHNSAKNLIERVNKFERA